MGWGTVVCGEVGGEVRFCEAYPSQCYLVALATPIKQIQLPGTRTDGLPESIIFEVLSANPDELKKKELMEHLQTKPDPLPEYMIEILESLTGNVTYKTILQSQMAHYGRLEGRAAGILLRDMLRDSTAAPKPSGPLWPTGKACPWTCKVDSLY